MEACALLSWTGLGRERRSGELCDFFKGLLTNSSKPCASFRTHSRTPRDQKLPSLPFRAKNSREQFLGLYFTFRTVRDPIDV